MSEHGLCLITVWYHSNLHCIKSYTCNRVSPDSDADPAFIHLGNYFSFAYRILTVNEDYYIYEPNIRQHDIFQ